MKYLSLAFKRAMRTVYVPVLLVLCALTAFFAPLMSAEEGMPTAGVYSADDSNMAGRVVDYLSENRFEKCDSEAVLREKIARGDYNCGVIICEDFEKRVMNGDTDELVLYLTTPSTFVPMVYQNHVMAAIYREYAPYITADLISDEHFRDHEVIDRYNELISEGGSFTFEVMREDNVAIDGNHRAFAYTIGLCAIFIFALIMYGVCSAVTVDLDSMRVRIGAKNAIRYTVIPSLAVRAVGVVIAFSAGTLLSALYSGNSALIPLIGAVAIYTLLITAFGVALAAICPKVKVIQTVTFFVLIAGLMICPIYYDLSMVIPWIGTFRNVLPVYWLWICEEKLLMMTVISVISVVGSFTLLNIISQKRK